MLVGGGEYNSTGSRSLQFVGTGLVAGGPFAPLGGADERTAGPGGGSSSGTSRGVATGGGRRYLVPVANRPVCVTRVRTA